MKFFSTIVLLLLALTSHPQEYIDPKPIESKEWVSDSLLVEYYDVEEDVILDHLAVYDYNLCPDSYPLLIKEKELWSVVCVGWMGHLCFGDFYYEEHQLNDGRDELFVYISEGYGRGYCHGSWMNDLETLYVIDLDRDLILLELAVSEYFEEYGFPNGCDEEEEVAVDENDDQQLEEEEYEVLMEYLQVDNVVSVDQGHLIIENIVKEAEDYDHIPLGIWLWNNEEQALERVEKD